MRTRTLAASLPALALLLTAAWAFAEHGGGTRYVPYQGRLELAGQVVDGPVEMTFSFYASEQGGSALDSVTRSVDVSGGAFALDIGPVPDSVFDEAALFLGVAVEGQELGARQRIRGAAYAVRGQAGQPFRASSLVVDGSADIQAARVGDVGHGAAWPGFANQATDADSYALVQNAGGLRTIVNAAAGGEVQFNLGNVKQAAISDAGLVLKSGTALRGLTVTTHTAAVALAGGAGVWELTDTRVLTPTASSLCVLSGSSLSHTTAAFTSTSDYVSFSKACSVVEANGSWQLVANATRAFHGHPLSVGCAATCLRWDQ